MADDRLGTVETTQLEASLWVATGSLVITPSAVTP